MVTPEHRYDTGITEHLNTGITEHRYDHPVGSHPNVMGKNLECSLKRIQLLNDVDSENTI